ncbi:MAG: hypothetical protein F4X26_03225 [Chloroflexi bacterium]|nr:hypothetical protein [Chloroflexota bacterium]
MLDPDELLAGTDGRPTNVGRWPPLERISLRELVTRTPEEIDRLIRSAEIVIDGDEVAAWDATVTDGLDG